MTKFEEKQKRAEVANQVLLTIDESFRFSFDGTKLKFSWKTWRGLVITKRWSSSSCNFMPPFHREMACGHTCVTAVTQLARWVQGRSVLPTTSWRYWKTLRMWKDDESADSAIAILESADYPASPVCVFCGKEFTRGGWDWFTKPKEGVGCFHGCGQ